MRPSVSKVEWIYIGDTLRIHTTKWMMEAPISSASLHVIGTGNNPGRHLRNIKRKDIYFVQDAPTGVVKIGLTTNIEQRIKTLNMHHRGSFRVLFSITNVPMHFESAVHQFCKSAWISGEFFRPSLRVSGLLEIMAKDHAGIGGRMRDVTDFYSKLGRYFDFERAFLYACNPANGFPPPYKGIDSAIDLETVRFEVISGEPIAPAPAG